ncbi:hypothetical protein [Sphingomonas sp. HMP6]|uniref:hypothetical protein n=1 Tax=Sphingomonas sp. HMP6 TaxID=1517551 RepID=UPI001596AA8F|nr:hypothetical protein [Sphingomonas sp. HMP6]
MTDGTAGVTGSTELRRSATMRGMAGTNVNQNTEMLAASALAKTRKPTTAIFQLHPSR